MTRMTELELAIMETYLHLVFTGFTLDLCTCVCLCVLQIKDGHPGFSISSRLLLPTGSDAVR